jgi:hypothetical protein
MAVDLDRTMKLDLSYPGISFGYESWALDTYLKVLDEQLSFAQDQYRLRAKRELERREPELMSDQVDDELWKIDEAVETQVPRFFRIGALVPIWGLFESFVFDIANYVRKREGLDLSLRDVRASNFRKQAEMYFEGTLRMKLPWSDDERARLGYLQQLRNLVAHRNGRVSDLSPEKQRELDALVASVSGVKVETGALLVSPDYITEAKELVFDLVGKLNQMIADRYDGPSIQYTET